MHLSHSRPLGCIYVQVEVVMRVPVTDVTYDNNLTSPDKAHGYCISRNSARNASTIQFLDRFCVHNRRFASASDHATKQVQAACWCHPMVSYLIPGVYAQELLHWREARHEKQSWNDRRQHKAETNADGEVRQIRRTSELRSNGSETIVPL